MHNITPVLALNLCITLEEPFRVLVAGIERVGQQQAAAGGLQKGVSETRGQVMDYNLRAQFSGQFRGAGDGAELGFAPALAVAAERTVEGRDRQRVAVHELAHSSRT